MIRRSSIELCESHTHHGYDPSTRRWNAVPAPPRTDPLANLAAQLATTLAAAPPPALPVPQAPQPAGVPSTDTAAATRAAFANFTQRFDGDITPDMRTALNDMLRFL